MVKKTGSNFDFEGSDSVLLGPAAEDEGEFNLQRAFCRSTGNIGSSSAAVRKELRQTNALSTRVLQEVSNSFEWMLLIYSLRSPSAHHDHQDETSADRTFLSSRDQEHALIRTFRRNRPHGGAVPGQRTPGSSSLTTNVSTDGQRCPACETPSVDGTLE